MTVQASLCRTLSEITENRSFLRLGEKKNIKNFLLEIFSFFNLRKIFILHGCIFVMIGAQSFSFSFQNYDSSESKLRREFEVYGPIRKVGVVNVAGWYA